MSRQKYSDAVMELTELAAEIMADVRQQAVYYRASVYKDETIKAINRRVDHLAVIVRILKDSDLSECIADFRASAAPATPVSNFDSITQSSECQLTVRIMRFLIDANAALEKLRSSVRKNVCQMESKQLVKSINRNRKELVAMSRHGSRAWMFLQSL